MLAILSVAVKFPLAGGSKLIVSVHDSRGGKLACPQLPPKSWKAEVSPLIVIESMISSSPPTFVKVKFS